MFLSAMVDSFLFRNPQIWVISIRHSPRKTPNFCDITFWPKSRYDVLVRFLGLIFRHFPSLSQAVYDAINNARCHNFIRKESGLGVAMPERFIVIS